jgi:hypothetical protein
MPRLVLPILLMAAALTQPAAAAPPASERALMLELRVPLAGDADALAWRPRSPFARRPAAADGFSGTDIANNLAEGWWGIGILAVGGAWWLYQENKD